MPQNTASQSRPVPLTNRVEVSRSLQNAVEKTGEWIAEPQERTVTLRDGSKLPALVYESKRPAVPDLAVLSTSQALCKGEGACWFPSSKVIVLGQAEVDSVTFVNKLVFPKKGILPEADREKLQIGIIRFELTMAETGGDLYQAYKALLAATRNEKAPAPKEVLSAIFNSRSLEDYLFSAMCYGAGDNSRSAEFMHRGKSFTKFVDSLFRDAQVQERNAVLNPESPLSHQAFQNARARYDRFTGR